MKHYKLMPFLAHALFLSTACGVVNIGTHLTYQLGDTNYAQSESIILVADIDGKIGIEWNEHELASQIGIEQGQIAKGDPLFQRIEFLKQVVDHFFTANVYLQELKHVDGQLQAARLEGTNSIDKTSELEVARNNASNRFSTRALAGIELVLEAQKNLIFLQDKTLANALYDELNNAVLVSYEEMSTVTGKFLTVEMERLREELSIRLEEGESINVYITAQIHSAGSSRALHLEGYDDISVGLPVPFARFQIAVSERTKRELEAAESLGNIIKDKDKFLKEVEAAIMAVKEQITVLGKTLKTEIVDNNLRNLEQALRESSDTTVSPLIEKVKRARTTIKSFTEAPEFSSTADAAILIEIAGQLQTTVWEVRFVAQNASRELAALIVEIESHIQAIPANVVSQSLSSLRAFSASIKNDPDVAQVFSKLDGIVNALGLSRQVASELLETSRIGRNALSDQSLDTWLDLLTSGERHPGDMIFISVKVTTLKDNKEEVTISESRQRIQLRVIGFYVETRGALFFVDPDASEYADQSFEPAVTLSYMGHVGFRRGSFWNTWVNPGLGLSLSLLDFENNRDIELGLSGSLSLINDFLYVGYGRNLQVKTDFFYFGVNPLVFGELLGQRASHK